MPPIVEIVRGLVVFLLSTVLAIASICDVQERRIPNWTTLAVAGLFLPWTLVGPAISVFSSLEAAFAAFLISFGLYALRVIGAGDSKLITVSALFVGWGKLIPFLTLVALAGGVIAIISLALDPARAMAVFSLGNAQPKGRGVPYGVAIALATIIITGGSLLHDVTAGAG
jgi:prepilin peptidase CpaA